MKAIFVINTQLRPEAVKHPQGSVSVIKWSRGVIIF